MSLFEFLIAVIGAGMVVLQTVMVAIQMENRDLLRTLLAQSSQRRRWVREEHEE